jgi:hypothetical protein
VDLLPLAQFTHNTWVNESTRATPFKVLIGHTPTIQEQEQDTNIPEVVQRKNWLERGRLQAQAALRNAQKVLQQRRERKKGERFYKGFNKGDQVWLEGTNLQLTHPSAKLAPRQYSPFTITDKISPVVFRLALPGHWAIHNVFHASLLTPYWETLEHGTNFLEPPPEMIKGEEEYEVECIVNSQCYGRDKKLQFLAHWKGYSIAHNSWEDATDVHAPKLIKEYYGQKWPAV